MSNDKAMYLTAARQGGGNSAYVYENVYINNLFNFFFVIIFFFILRSFHVKVCKTLLSSCQCNLAMVNLHCLKFVNIKQKDSLSISDWIRKKVAQCRI